MKNGFRSRIRRREAPFRLRVLLLLLFALSFLATQANQAKTVVYINAYSENHIWSGEILRPIKEAFGKTNQPIRIKEIYLNAKSVRDFAHREAILNAYLSETKDSIALVIVTGYEAVQHVILSQDSLFDTVPIVCGAFIDRVIFKNCSKNVCGVVANIDVNNTYLTARDMFPNAKKAYVWADSSASGQYLLSQAKEQLRGYENDFSIEYGVSAANYNELLEKAANLDPDSFLILCSWQQDSMGRFVFPSMLYPLLAEISPAPIFLLTDNVLENTPLIGGYVVSPSGIGEIAAQMSLKILNGASPRTLGIKTLEATPVFDRKAIRSKEGSLSAIPRDAEVRNSLRAEIKAYQEVIVTCILLFILLAVVVLQARNIRIQKKIKLELQHALAKSEKAEQLKSAFLSSISHEMRTPLNAIIGFTELALDSQNQQEREEFMRIVYLNNKLLLTMVNDALELSKLEAGFLELHSSEFDLSQLFQELYLSYREQVPESIELRCETPGYSQCCVTADRERLLQILNYFMSNAIKFTKNGVIRYGYNLVNGAPRIYVADTGIGIAPEDQERIFHRFEKVNEFSQGVGLGLSICQSIVRARGGKIGVESQLGAGATFWAWIPCPCRCGNKKQTHVKDFLFGTKNNTKRFL